YDSFTHQQMYSDWLKRAVDGGLRLIITDAVNNKLLCDASNKAPGRTCDDTEAVDAQINVVKAMQNWIDNQSGGAGRGWFRIAYSGRQARDIIAAGNLAVVLGIEVNQPLGCRPGQCDQARVRTALERYRNMGVRKITIAHLADTPFAGAALYNDVFNFNNM